MVVAILGILAAVVVPNVAKFVGAGSEQAAETETSNVQAAVDAAIADLGLFTLNTVTGCGANFGWDGGCQLNDGLDGLPGTIDDVALYPTYLRLQAAGGDRTYSWDNDPMGLVSLDP